MPLRSRLFSNDKKLEAAAALDSAHVARGASGEHVRKIQRALNAAIGSKLVEDSVFGPSTAACVLEYKKSRRIVNRAYQTQADDIVGKLTIAMLDAETALLEVIDDLNAMPVTLRDLKEGKIADSKVQLAVTTLGDVQRRISSS